MTLRPPVTIPVAFVQAMLSGLEAKAIDVGPYLDGAGIDRRLFDEPGARISAAQYVALFRLLTHQLDDEILGFLARPLRRGSFALIVRSSLGAATLESAMRRAARTFRLLQDEVLLETVRDGALAGWAVRFVDPAIPRPNFLPELLLRVLWRYLSWLVAGEISLSRCDFAFPIPSYVAGYSRIFPCPLSFEREHSAFWFDAAKLKLPVRRDEAAARAFLADAQGQVIVPRRGDDTVDSRVRSHLLQTQPDWPDRASTATALHMSTTTLQRRLAAGGTSFQSLKDELRRDIAILRLNTSSVPVATVAIELGFADTAAFQRAFKGWTGSAPGIYRRGSN